MALSIYATDHLLLHIYPNVPVMYMYEASRRHLPRDWSSSPSKSRIVGVAIDYTLTPQTRVAGAVYHI